MAIEQHKNFENGENNGLQALEESLLVMYLGLFFCLVCIKS